MEKESTAVILIGFQNDYFAQDGILHEVIEEAARAGDVLANTVSFLERLVPTPVLLVSTPIVFTRDYRELHEPVGILETIRNAGAFRGGSRGSETIKEIRDFGDRIVEVPGKRGLNAFSNTALDDLLREKGITDVVLAGVVTSHLHRFHGEIGL